MSEEDEPQYLVNDLEKWIEFNGPRLFLFAQQQTRNHADAQDVYQEAIVKVLRTAKKGEENYIPPLHFFFVSIRQVSIDIYRKHIRRTVREETYAETHNNADSWFVDPVEVEEDHSRLQLVLRQLPKDQQEVVVLKIWGGQTFRAIAEILNIPQNTAASRYRYAIEQLRCSLKLEAL